ncbi:MAG: gliding motility protein GldL [Bacteroidales bacterium]|jgi:gliding motility-associated protein GldL|nr:gliding motility protein GldL [Bacteroidales bacterium]
MGIYNLVRSKGYKKFMSYLYGWGAALVIIGALFKIQHWNLAGVMLTAGMATEAIIFFFSAFEPLHVNYKWELIYPELALGDDQPVATKVRKAVASGSPTQQLDQMLTEAKIGPELIESLATGMRNLSENAQKLSATSDAAVVTDSYTSSLAKAAESVRNLSLQYDKTSDLLSNDHNFTEEYMFNVKKASEAVEDLAAVYQKTTDLMKTAGPSYSDELVKLNQNLSSINTMYEMQSKNSQMMIENFKNIEENLKSSAENTAKYKEEVDKLSKNIAQLSNVYGNMVAAMSLSTKA